MWGRVGDTDLLFQSLKLRGSSFQVSLSEALAACRRAFWGRRKVRQEDMLALEEKSGFAWSPGRKLAWLCGAQRGMAPPSGSLQEEAEAPKPPVRELGTMSRCGGHHGSDPCGMGLPGEK